MNIKAILAATVMSLFSASAMAETISIKLPDHALTPYMSEFIEKSLESQGNEAKIEVVKGMTTDRFDAMISKGEPGYINFKGWRRSIKNSIVLDVALTDGLIGKRVFFVPKSDVDRYASVKTLDDLRATGAVGGFGKNWYDVKVWKKNNLPVFEKDGEWRALYKMVASGKRGVDYFSRGILEIPAEAPKHPDLAIEPHLLVVYPGDFNLFLSPAFGDQANTIKTALEAGVKSGLRDKLLHKYFKGVFDSAGLNMDGRTRIDLKSPQ